MKLSVQISLLAGQVFGCARILEVGRTEAALCATGAVGAVRARSHGLASNGDVSRFWLAGGMLARVDGRLFGPFWWTLRGGAFVPRTRQSFEVRRAGVVYEPAIVGVSAGLGVWTTIW